MASMTTAASRAFDQLSSNRLFEGIERHLLENIAPEVKVVWKKAGEVIFHEGDPGDLLYLVGEGGVKISKSGRGGQQETLGFIEPGNFFGEMALLDGQPRSAMATATEATLLGSRHRRNLPADPRDRAESAAHEFPPLRLATFARRELAFHRRGHAVRAAQPCRRDVEFDHPRSEEPDLHRPLLLGFDRGGKQRSAPARADLDDGQSRRRHARDDAGAARLRARLHLAERRDCLHLARDGRAEPAGAQAPARPQHSARETHPLRWRHARSISAGSCGCWAI